MLQRPPSSRPYVGKEDFFHFATKQVNPNDTDWGAWIERRREAFMEAMVANPFFWYSALTTALLIVLMIAFGVRVVDEKRKLWHAAEISNRCLEPGTTLPIRRANGNREVQPAHARLQQGDRGASKRPSKPGNV